MSRDLQEDIDIGLSRSTDGGQTWSLRVIMDTGTYGGLPQARTVAAIREIIADHETGDIFCFAV
ncbi:MAG: sialidase family protein [Planctomycetaceae bacterium]